MQVNLKHLLVFTKDSPKVTTGFFIPENKKLVTGHENGHVFMWDLGKNTKQKLYECSSKIETISCFENKQIVIGSNSGDIVVLSLENPNDIECLQSATPSVHSRVWRSIWIRDDILITSSTYGVVNLRQRIPPNICYVDNLSGHAHSVFSINKSEGGLLATGDYIGNILIWRPKDWGYETIQRLQIQQAVEDIAWHNDSIIAAINLGGRLHLFEKETEKENEWKLVFEVENATSEGNCIHITEDGRTVFAGTGKEVIQFDIKTQQIDSIKISGTKRIFSKGDTVFILTSHGLYSFERKPVEIKAEFIKYKYVKISLIGHTGVGKSTLCSYITTGKPGEDKSTLVKKVWMWKIPDEGGLERCVIFHDHGGQETALGTLNMSSLSDSDIILILFQQNDEQTFRKASDILDLLKDNVAEKTKIFFVQTHTDQPIDEAPYDEIQNLILDGKIVDNLKVCPKDGTTVEKFKDKLKNEIPWKNVRIMIKSKYADGVLNTIFALQEQNTGVIKFEDFKRIYRETTGLSIPSKHLEFLLEDYSNQGIIEYYPKITDFTELIIFNEPEYNALRAKIPIEVKKKNGIISKEDINKTFENSKYLPIIDQVYLKNKTCIENFELRIFPGFLPNKPIKIPTPFGKYLKEQPFKKKILRDQKINISRIIEALSEQKGRCINVSQNDGLFSWEENAIIYYKFQQIGNSIKGFNMELSYCVGGKKKDYYEELEKDFINIIEKLYGPFVAEKELLKSESFWRKFITKAMDPKRVENQLWDFKETLEMWHTTSNIRFDAELKFCEEVASFANAKGGVLIIGITDSLRKVVGIDDLENKLKHIRDVIKRHIKHDEIVYLQQVILQDESGAKKSCLVVAIAQTKGAVSVKDQRGRYSYPLRHETGLEIVDKEVIERSKIGIPDDNYDFIGDLDRFIVD